MSTANEYPSGSTARSRFSSSTRIQRPAGLDPDRPRQDDLAELPPRIRSTASATARSYASGSGSGNTCIFENGALGSLSPAVGIDGERLRLVVQPERPGLPVPVAPHRAPGNGSDPLRSGSNGIDPNSSGSRGVRWKRLDVEPGEELSSVGGAAPICRPESVITHGSPLPALPATPIPARSRKKPPGS